MAKMKSAKHATASGATKKASASRTVKSLGKQGTVPISRIRAAVKKVSASR